MTALYRWLLPLLIFAAVFARADTLEFSTGGLSDTGQEFLAVEDAYQLYVTRKSQQLALEWVIAPGYYLYRDRFKVTVTGDSGQLTNLPLEFEQGVVRYDDYYEQDVTVYYRTTTVEATLPENIAPRLIEVQSQGCADAGLCYPPRTQFAIWDSATGAATVSEGRPQLPASFDTAPPGSGLSLPLMVIFALLGGLILNLMPCVFPVLSIKVLSLAQGHLSAHNRHLHGLAYTFGVVLSFLAAALLLLTLRAGGEALGWGFQLQSPGFIIALTYLFFVLGLNFSGYFSAGARLMNIGQAASSGAKLHHSFLTGVLAAVVASPCSAPFMGTALGFALTQPTPVAVLVFLALGLGMALPFLLLTWAPALLKKMPRPGPWMVRLKEFLGFPLYLTCVWLLWILGNQTGGDTVVAVLFGLVLVALAIWLAGSGSKIARILAALALAAAIAAPAERLYGERTLPLWEPYSEARLNSLLNAGKPVFVNLTADWCITCLANEKMALSSEAFETTLREQGITYLKGDWTNYDPAITALLNANGRSGVPLYLFYPQGVNQPKILPQLLSKTTILRALKQNTGS